MKFDAFKRALLDVKAWTNEPVIYYRDFGDFGVGVQLDSWGCGWISIAGKTSAKKLKDAFSEVCRDLTEIKYFLCMTKNKRVGKLCGRIMQRIDGASNKEREIYLRENLWAV